MDATSRLFVQDLPPHCDEQALRKHFSEYGVTDVQIPRRKTDKKKSRGFAFVGLESADAAARAVKALNGAYWRTSKLRVAPAAKRKAPQPPAPPPKKKAKKAVPQPKERLAPTRRERFLELSGVKVAAPPAVAEAEEAPEKCEEAFDAGLDDLAYLRSKRDGVRGGVLARAPRRVGGSAESAPTTASRRLTLSPRRPTRHRPKKRRTATTMMETLGFSYQISRTALVKKKSSVYVRGMVVSVKCTCPSIPKVASARVLGS